MTDMKKKKINKTRGETGKEPPSRDNKDRRGKSYAGEVQVTRWELWGPEGSTRTA